MSYIQDIKDELQKYFKFNETYVDLLDVYALLVLIKGERCTLEDVHDAWSVWQNNLDQEHRSLKPFDELTLEVQLLDEKYRDVIRKVATNN